MSVASATTRPSVPSPFSEEGVGYAPALRTLMMEQGATSLPGCFIDHNSLIPCMTMSMFLAPVHRTHGMRLRAVRGYALGAAAQMA